MSFEIPELNRKHGIFKQLSMIFLTLYIYSIYVLSYTQYHMFCSIFLLASALFSILNIIMTKESFKLEYSFFSLLLFVIYVLLSTFWVETDIGVNSFLMTFVQLFGFYLVVRMNIQDETDFKNVLLAVFVGTTIMCLYVLFFYGIGEIIARISVGRRIGQEINQSNGMGIYCTILNAISLYYIMYEKKYWCTAVLAMSCLVMLGAGSRKSFLLMALTILLLFMFKSNTGKAVRFIAVGIILILAVYMVLEIASSGDNYFFFRIAQLFEIFQDNQANLRDDSLLSRSDMIKYGMELWSQNPIFGYGPVQYEHFYSLIYGLRRPPHSTFIQVLVGFGSIGFVLYYGIYVYVVKKLIPMLKKRSKYSALVFTLIVVFLVNDIGANMLYSKYQYLFFGIFAGYVSIIVKKEGENHNEDPYSGTEIPYQPDPDMSGTEG